MALTPQTIDYLSELFGFTKKDSSTYNNGIGSSMTSAGSVSAGDVGSWLNNLSGVSANNEFTAQEAQKQRDWEEHMSNTSYQRAVADMKEAGLNPATLSAGSISGASTPSGAYASGSGNSNSLLSAAITAIAKVAIKAMK